MQEKKTLKIDYRQKYGSDLGLLEEKPSEFYSNGFDLKPY